MNKLVSANGIVGHGGNPTRAVAKLKVAVNMRTLSKNTVSKKEIVRHASERVSLRSLAHRSLGIFAIRKANLNVSDGNPRSEFRNSPIRQCRVRLIMFYLITDISSEL